MADEQIKIDDLPVVTTVADTDSIIINNSTATSQVTKANLLKEIKTQIDTNTTNISNEVTNRTNADINLTRRTRNNITSNLTNLTTAIAEQNLEKYGYAIGDYFVGASGYYYYLADMDCRYGGHNDYSIVNTHHCGIVVDTKSTTTWLASGSATNYSSSTLHTFLTDTALVNIKSDITTLFGDWSEHLIARTELDNAVGGWGTTWTGLADTYICALSEVEVYGSRIFGVDGQQTGTCSKPLELFAKYKWNDIFGYASVWLKSLDSSYSACSADHSGFAGHNSLTYSGWAAGLILFH